LAIARTIRKRGPLHSLSEDQQLRIERIRLGIQAGTKTESEALLTSDCENGSAEMTNCKIVSAHLTEHITNQSIVPRSGDEDDQKISEQETMPQIHNSCSQDSITKSKLLHPNSAQKKYRANSKDVALEHQGSSHANVNEGIKISSVCDHPTVEQSSALANSKSANSCALVPVNSQDVKPVVLMSDNYGQKKSYSQMHRERMKPKKLMVKRLLLGTMGSKVKIDS